MRRYPVGVVLLTVVGTLVASPLTASAESDGGLARDEVLVRDAVAALPVADEQREGYSRTLFKHWVDADRNACNTRREVLIAEAVEPPTVGARCALVGGSWYSPYDDVTLDDTNDIDIDHVVPLAEAWDSGAWSWDAKQRELYANDLDEERSLIAVTDRTNQSKADRDPHEWMPPNTAYECVYLEDWTIVKTRWRLSVDVAEKETLTELADRCPNTTLSITPGGAISALS